MGKVFIVKWSRGFIALAMILVFLSTPVTSLKAKAQVPGNFSVRAVIPENQIDTRQSYFDLRVEPGQTQTLTVVIDNSRSEPLSAIVRLNAASTGRNGLIVYSEPDIRDEGMELSISDVASLQSGRVTVPAMSSAEVKIDLNIPEAPFAGVLLGGIVISADDREDDAVTTGGVTLKNAIAYVIGLKLTGDGEDVAPDFAFVDIAPGLVNYRTAVTVGLRNLSPLIVKEMALNAKIYREGNDAVIGELNLPNAEMAPVSRGDFVVDWGNKAFRSGNYRLEMTAEYNGRIWEWNESFTIAGEAGGINREAVGIERSRVWLYLMIGLPILLAIGFMAYWLGRRGRNTGDAD